MDSTDNIVSSDSYSMDNKNGPNTPQTEFTASDNFPVKIIDEIDMLAPVEIPEGVEVFVSHAYDESVVGYSEDRRPSNRGIKEIAEVVRILEDCGISCCMVEESALAYYGSMRVMDVSVV